MVIYPSSQTKFEVGSYVLVEYKNVFRRINAFFKRLKKLSKLYFKVHWSGYDETSWEPWANVRAKINFMNSYKITLTKV